MAEQVGRVLGGRYRLRAALGAGSSAQVFLADDASLGRQVAVKVLHPALAGDGAFLRRFQAEARAAAALTHPHIMAVYDWGEDDESPFLVCEYLAGGSLRALLDTGRRLSPSQALLVGLETAHGLHYAHRRSLVHRDIKPGNLLFDTDGRLRIADFGLARALAEAAWTEPAGALLGTARYAAPEQVKGESVDGRADVYALAVTLVEAVTGTVPFATDTTIGTLMARVDVPLQAPAELDALGPVIERAGRPDPRDRPDAAAFALALDAAARQLPRPDPLPLVGPPSDVILLTDDATELGLTPSGGPPSVPTAGRRRRRWPWVVLLLVLLAGGAGTAWALTRPAPVPTHRMPALRGLREAEAVAALQPLKVKVQIARPFVDGTEAGLFLESRPLAGTRVKEGSTVRLTISAGAPPVDVPDLASTTKATATEKLVAADLAVGHVASTYDEQAPAGAVLSWAHKGEKVPKHTAIDLNVSDGPRPRTVPTVAGKTFDQAAAALQLVGLNAVRADAFSDTVPKDQVISTSPAAGASVGRGGRVTVTISKGPDLVGVPDVSGKSVQDATATMQAAGLQIGNVFGPPNKKIFTTDPAAGTQVHRGSSVNVYTK
ncbi:MAG: protein kinase family protein with domain [Acidimicrobiales bacterium]|nr:protein kinase family protein with domain [Acidimicrobiales bacterium]